MKKAVKIIAMVLVVVMCLCVIPQVTLASGRTGWERYSDSWRYYENGRIVTGWFKVNGTWYCAPNRGNKTILTNGYYEIDGKTYYFDHNGSMKTGWVFVKVTARDGFGWQEFWTYHLPSGEAVRGWKKIGGKWYFFDREYNIPYMHYHWSHIDGKNYWLGEYNEGAMKTGWVHSWILHTEEDYERAWYYQLPSGESAIGWHKIDGVWYYFKTVECWGDIDYCYPMAENETLTINGVQYTFDASGAWVN